MIVNYSCRVQKGERVLIEEIGTDAKPLIKELIRAVYAAGGYPYLGLSDASLNREIMMNCSEEQLEFMREYELYQMKGMDAYIAVRASENTSELSDVPSEKLNLYSKMLRPVIDQRVDHTKWVIMRYPNNSMAQLSGMSLEAFEDFYYDVCTLDYAKMSEAMDPLVDLMNRTDKVRIVSLRGPTSRFRSRTFLRSSAPASATFLTERFIPRRYGIRSTASFPTIRFL